MDSLDVELVGSGCVAIIEVIEEGPAGKSAYETSLDLGFEGTESEWIDTLKGSSAYRVALDNGFVGTEEEWLESLKVGLLVSKEDANKILTNNGTKSTWEDLNIILSRVNLILDQGQLGNT